MKKLAGYISELIMDEYGENEFLKRLSDPYWFQSFGCVLGFDWHSSGLTTTTTGALKEALKDNEKIAIAGGKKTARKTPEEIQNIGYKLNLKEKQINELIKISRLSTKVDNFLIQDGFKLYHHTIFFSNNSWSIIQQGMNKSVYARRYHWIKKEKQNYICEPHSGIISDKITQPLNLTAKESEETRKCSLDLIKDNPIHLRKYFTNHQTTLFDFSKNNPLKYFKMSVQHFPKIDVNMNTLIQAYEIQPKNFEELILIKGMGQKNIRALALISHLIYGTELSWKDPIKYSFAHGGKDGWPFPVDNNIVNKNIEILKNAIKDSRINNSEKSRCLKRLNSFYSN